jgi:hypothetical protein
VWRRTVRRLGRLLARSVLAISLVAVPACGGGSGSNAARQRNGPPTIGSSLTVVGGPLTPTVCGSHQCQRRLYKLRATLVGVVNPVIATDVPVPQGMHFVGIRLKIQNLGPGAIDTGDIFNSQITDSDGRTTAAPGSAIGPAEATMPSACGTSSITVAVGGTENVCVSFLIGDGLKPIRFDLVVDSPEPDSAAIGGDHIWHLPR